MHKLQEIDNLQGDLSEQRHELAARAYEKGMACLSQSQLEGFTNPELLRDATASLLEAIRYQHHQPDPFIAMAYLQYLIGHRSSALHYLNEALSIDPGHRSAIGLSKLIRSDTSPRQPGMHFATRFEALLDQTIRELSMVPPPRACSDEESLSRLEGQAIQLRRHFDELIDLAGSDEEGRLQMIAQRLSQFEDAIHASFDLLDVHERLAEEKETLSSLDALTDTNSTVLEQELIQTLDHCDELADEINLLESEGLPVTELEADYAELAETVQEIQSHLQAKGVHL